MIYRRVIGVLAAASFLTGVHVRADEPKRAGEPEEVKTAKAELGKEIQESVEAVDQALTALIKAATDPDRAQSLVKERKNFRENVTGGLFLPSAPELADVVLKFKADTRPAFEAHAKRLEGLVASLTQGEKYDEAKWVKGYASRFRTREVFEKTLYEHMAKGTKWGPFDVKVPNYVDILGKKYTRGTRDASVTVQVAAREGGMVEVDFTFDGSKTTEKLKIDSLGTSLENPAKPSFPRLEMTTFDAGEGRIKCTVQEDLGNGVREVIFYLKVGDR